MADNKFETKPEANIHRMPCIIKQIYWMSNIHTRVRYHIMGEQTLKS